MTAKFLISLRERLDSASQNERVRDCVAGAGLALDPLPTSSEKTFEAEDWRALHADREAFAKDLRASVYVFISFNDAVAVNMLKVYLDRAFASDHFKTTHVKSLNRWNKKASQVHGKTSRQTEKDYQVS